MEDLIKRILEIDNKAQDMTSKAEQLRTDAQSQITQNIASLRQEYLERVNQRIRKIEEIERQHAEQSLQEKERHHTSLLMELNRKDQLHRQEWVEKIVQNVLEV